MDLQFWIIDHLMQAVLMVCIIYSVSLYVHTDGLHC